MPDEIKEKYGFKVGEKVLFTYSSGKKKTFIIKSFDPSFSFRSKPLQNAVRFTTGTWDYIKHISKIHCCDGDQLLFEFMR